MTTAVRAAPKTAGEWASRIEVRVPKMLHVFRMTLRAKEPPVEKCGTVVVEQGSRAAWTHSFALAAGKVAVEAGGEVVSGVDVRHERDRTLLSISWNTGIPTTNRRVVLRGETEDELAFAEVLVTMKPSRIETRQLTLETEVGRPKELVVTVAIDRAMVDVARGLVAIVSVTPVGTQTQAMAAEPIARRRV
jgi:hypothetical protein